MHVKITLYPFTEPSPPSSSRYTSSKIVTLLYGIAEAEYISELMIMMSFN